MQGNFSALNVGHVDDGVSDGAIIAFHVCFPTCSKEQAYVTREEVVHGFTTNVFGRMQFCFQLSKTIFL